MTRRLKLEELLSSIYAIEIWLELQRSKWMEQKTVSIDDAPMEKLQMLTSLYFPELKDEILLILACYRNIYMLILDIGELFIRSKIENNKIAQAAVDEFLNKYKPLYENARIVIAAIETKASKLMLEIATI